MLYPDMILKETADRMAAASYVSITINIYEHTCVDISEYTNDGIASENNIDAYREGTTVLDGPSPTLEASSTAEDNPNSFF
jgi:hypothetical protein